MRFLAAVELVNLPRPLWLQRTPPALETSSQVEKRTYEEKTVPSKAGESEIEEDENIDALIQELESQDGGVDYNAEEEEAAAGAARLVPEELLITDLHVGLTKDEILARRKKYGLNQMKEKKENMLLKFLGFFVGPIQFVMEAAAMLAAGLQDWVDFGVICALLLLNACVGFIQEYHAATVLHDGMLQEVEVPDVVPGELLVEEGTIISADGRIITEDAFLQVDQSTTTGESLAVDRHKGDVCLASSAVKRGEAFIVITATGDSTFVGRAASLVASTSSGTGHFTEVLNGMGTILLVLVIFTLLVVWVSLFYLFHTEPSHYRSNGIIVILEFTLVVTIIGVPVGLPAVVTTTMAVGAAYLAKKQAIVKKLSAIKSLAGVEILCSDKTGTLTKNKLCLSDPSTVSGVNPEDLMLTACLAASRKKKGIDSIDKSLPQVFEYRVVDFQPFDPVSKKVQAVVESHKGERIICVKGAPLAVLKTDKVAEFATRGFRSLGVARKRINSPWEILGIMPCSDPPRHDTARTIKEAVTLGLRIKMLTGDTVGIAKETSRQLGLETNVYNAKRLGLGGGSEMPSSKVYDFVEATDSFAKVFPQHKYNVANILQSRSYLVAITGNGPHHDTPSAVEATNIMLLTLGLSIFITTLKTSRQIFHRMYLYVIYRITLSLHLEIFLGLWLAILNTSLNLELVVFIAIFADIATLAIAYDNAPFSKLPVWWNLPKLWGMSILLGVVLAAGTWITLTTTFGHQNLSSEASEGISGGTVQDFSVRDPVIFLEASLTKNWLIFITRANAIRGAILIVNTITTLFCVFGRFVGGKTCIITVVHICVFSLGVFCVMSGIYYLLQGSQDFDDLMHGKVGRDTKKGEGDD
ncbi:plasma membrane ATPase [Bimuria novae-zelandiae CBS 107.79]|uniref:Plasma membrane ATPase n=1 Tax=Bimuria novae-zelandiae CBS 107.79 TaxID=1447943 RepID=A0A6A5UZC5_9PLEO|nr:plasma membrane ATPase [Bimuria novae-zelandiae CBS 107.79]